MAVEDTHFVRGRQNVSQHEDLLVADALGHRVRRRVGEGYANQFGLGAVDEVAEDPAAAAEALSVATLAAEST